MDTNQNDALLEYYMTLGAQQPGKDALMRQQRNIDYLRKTSAAPQGGYTQPGAGQPAIYVKPNALSQIASVAGEGLAGYQQGTNDMQARQFGEEGQSSFKAMIERLRKANAPYDFESQGAGRWDQSF